MAPAKRTAAATASKAPRAAKVAKVEVDPSIERCKSVFALLKEFGSKLPSSCVNMLRETAPLALATGKDERHKYQADVVSSINEFCDDLIQDQAAMLREAENQVANSATEKEQLEVQLSNLAAVDVSKREAKALASAELTAAQTVELEAKDALEQSQKDVSETERGIAENLSAKEKFETTFNDMWPALRDGEFSSKDWRSRNKNVGVIVPMLTSAPESLRAGLSQALKEKPESRGQFARKTVECAEAAFQEHIAAMGTEISRLTSVLEAGRAAVAQAEGKLEADTKAKDEAWERSIAAENAWLEVDAEISNLKNQLANFENNQAAKYREVDSQKAQQERLRDLVADFEALRDCTGAPGAAGEEQQLQAGGDADAIPAEA